MSNATRIITLPRYVPLSLEDGHEIKFNTCSIIDLVFCLQNSSLLDNDWHSELLGYVATHFKLNHLPIVTDQSPEAFFFSSDFKQRSKLAIRLYYLRKTITELVDRWNWEDLGNTYKVIAEHERPDLVQACEQLWPLLNDAADAGLGLLPELDRLLMRTWGVNPVSAEVTLVELIGEEAVTAKVAEVHGDDEL